METARGHRQHSRFLQCIDDNMLLHVTKEPIRRGVLLDLILTNKDRLVGNMKVKSSLGCTDHEMMEFRTLRERRRVKRKLTNLSFRRVDFDLFNDLLGRVPWDKASEGRGAQECWLVFRIHFLQAQERAIPRNRKPGKNARRIVWMKKEFLDKLKQKKNAYDKHKRRWKTGQVNWKEYRYAVQASTDEIRKAKTQI